MTTIVHPLCSFIVHHTYTPELGFDYAPPIIRGGVVFSRGVGDGTIWTGSGPGSTVTLQSKQLHPQSFRNER